MLLLSLQNMLFIMQTYCGFHSLRLKMSASAFQKNRNSHCQEPSFFSMVSTRLGLSISSLFYIIGPFIYACYCRQSVPFLDELRLNLCDWIYFASLLTMILAIFHWHMDFVAVKNCVVSTLEKTSSMIFYSQRYLFLLISDIFEDSSRIG